MSKKRGFPMQGELVIGIVKRIHPNSVDVHLEEYDRDAMLHISEIVSGWVKSIKDHLKIGQKIVTKVQRINEPEGYISLSLKRVDRRQEKEKLKEYNLDAKAEKMLEMAAGQKKKSLAVAYKEVGYDMQEAFGSLFKAFKKSISNPEALESRGISESWITVIRDIAEKSIEQKEFEFQARATLRSYDENGLKEIKNVLKKAEELGASVHYLSAPLYMLKFTTKDAKKGEKQFNGLLKNVESASKKVEIKVEIIK